MPYSFKEIELKLKQSFINLKDGFYSTILNDACESIFYVAVIIPHRDRISHLKILLNNLHRFISKQKINFKIFVVEPVKNITFNRALLFNIGYIESLKIDVKSNSNYKWDCFILHDVDLIPENTQISYKCDSLHPLHLSVTSNDWNYMYVYVLIYFIFYSIIS